MRLRDALSRYYHCLLTRDEAATREAFVKRLSQLEELVASLQGKQESETLQRISEQLSWLHDRQQVPEVVAVVRDLAPFPNVRLVVSDAMIADVTRESIDRVDPLNDQVLGTTVHGTSHLVGTMAAHPIADRRQARLEARLEGDADTSGRGYHGPVRAQVVGQASVRATGEIWFDRDGFQVGPARAHVSATGRPVCLWTTCKSRLANRMITNVARRRAARTQELADCIASRHAEQRLEQQIATQLQTRVEDLQTSFQKRFRDPLVRHETFPRRFTASSRAERAQVDMLLGTEPQTGAFRSIPSRQWEGVLSAQVHETAANNLAGNVLAGRTINEKDLRAYLARVFGDLPDAEPVDENELLDIQLDEARPLTFRVRDSLLTVTIRADRFIRRRTKYPAMHMIVRYAFEQDDQGVMLTQQGEPEVVPHDFEETGRRRLAAREVAARRFITAMLQRELAETYRLGAIPLPGQAARYGRLAVTRLVADNGWLQVDFERAGE